MAQLSAQEVKMEQQAWRATQKHKQLHEQRTRIILDDTGNIVPHRSHDLPPNTPAAAEGRRTQALMEGREQAETQSSDLLGERYQSMKASMQEEIAVLRSILASSSHPATPLPVVEGEVLPPTTSPLLGTFSPHLVSHHLPTLFSYPVFHFGRGQPFRPTHDVVARPARTLELLTALCSVTLLSLLYRRLSTTLGVLLHTQPSTPTHPSNQPTTLPFLLSPSHLSHLQPYCTHVLPVRLPHRQWNRPSRFPL